MKLKSWEDISEESWQKLTLTLPDVSEPRHGLWSAGHLLKEIKGSPLLWVHLEEGEIGAMVSARTVDEGVTEIIYLYTARAFRRQGLMRALLREVIESFPAEHQLWLEVAATNTVAQELYEALGFTLEGVRPLYYSDDTDSWVYRYTNPRPERGKSPPS